MGSSFNIETKASSSHWLGQVVFEAFSFFQPCDSRGVFCIWLFSFHMGYDILMRLVELCRINLVHNGIRFFSGFSLASQRLPSSKMYQIRSWIFLRFDRGYHGSTVSFKPRAWSTGLWNVGLGFHHLSGKAKIKHLHNDSEGLRVRVLPHGPLWKKIYRLWNLCLHSLRHVLQPFCFGIESYLSREGSVLPLWKNMKHIRGSWSLMTGIPCETSRFWHKNFQGSNITALHPLGPKPPFCQVLAWYVEKVRPGTLGLPGSLNKNHIENWRNMGTWFRTMGQKQAKHIIIPCPKVAKNNIQVGCFFRLVVQSMTSSMKSLVFFVIYIYIFDWTPRTFQQTPVFTRSDPVSKPSRQLQRWELHWGPNHGIFLSCHPIGDHQSRISPLAVGEVVFFCNQQNCVCGFCVYNVVEIWVFWSHWSRNWLPRTWLRICRRFCSACNFTLYV